MTIPVRGGRGDDSACPLLSTAPACVHKPGYTPGYAGPD
jgi:hypothetical protein